MRFLSLLLLGLLAALPARAEDTTILTALDQIPSDASLWAGTRIVDIVDLKALKQVAGVGDELRFVDFADMNEADEEAATQLLFRLQSGAGFIPYLIAAGNAWQEQVGVDFFQLDWFTDTGTPPHALLLLGGEALPKGEALSVLAANGLQPTPHGGATAWAKGENDGVMDLQGREPDFPFWGWLGVSVRLFRSDVALVGARTWPDFDLALATAQGTAESLADLPRFRTAAEVAALPLYTSGPILQITFVDQAVGEGAIGPVADGLPHYDLAAFADREDATGQQVFVVLSYGTDAQSAVDAAAALPGRIAAYKDQSGHTLAERFPGLTVQATSLATESGDVAVAVLSIPPVPTRIDGKIANRSILYGQFIRMLYSRDLGLIAPRS